MNNVAKERRKGTRMRINYEYERRKVTKYFHSQDTCSYIISKRLSSIKISHKVFISLFLSRSIIRTD